MADDPIPPADLARRLAQAQTELDVLYQFGLAIHAPRTLAPLYRLLYDQVARAMPVDASFIALLLPEQRQLQTVLSIDSGAEYPPDPPWGFDDKRPSGWVATHGQPIRFADYNVEIEERFPNAVRGHFGVTDKPSRAWMTVPMLIDREIKGIVNVQSYEYGVYSEREERLLVTLASMLAIASAQSQLVGELEQIRAALSAPLIPVTAELLIVPLLGALDQERLAVVQESLLPAIQQERIKQIVFDLTGVAQLDQEASQGLLQITRAVELLGAHCMISGLRPALARDLARHGTDLSQLAAVRNVKQALALCGVEA